MFRIQRNKIDDGFDKKRKSKSLETDKEVKLKFKRSNCKRINELPSN